jgi:N-acetylmuramoyl-L-alanine amidase
MQPRLSCLAVGSPRRVPIALAALFAAIGAACIGASPSVPSPPGAGLAFAIGACQRFGPTRGNQHQTVFIDAGHGGPDPGTTGQTQAGAPIAEKTATLAVALDLERLLRATGYTVVLSRTRDTSVLRLAPGDLESGVFSASGEHRDLLARIDCANAAKAGLLLSIHFNAFANPAVGGAETFYDAARPFAAQNRTFAMLVQQDAVGALAAAGWQIPDRGIAVDTSDNAPTLTARAAAYPYLLELGPAQAGWLEQPSQMPGALCEPLFLSDPIEASIAASSAGQAAIARGFAEAITAQLSSVSPTPRSGG